VFVVLSRVSIHYVVYINCIIYMYSVVLAIASESVTVLYKYKYREFLAGFTFQILLSIAKSIYSILRIYTVNRIRTPTCISSV